MSLIITSESNVSNVKVITRSYYAFRIKKVMYSTALDGRVWFNWNVAMRLYSKLLLVVVCIFLA